MNSDESTAPDLDYSDRIHLQELYNHHDRDRVLGWLRGKIAVPLRHQFDEEFDEDAFYNWLLDYYVDTDVDQPEPRQVDWWRLEPAITDQGPFGGMEVGARSQVTLHYTVEKTIEVSHLPNRAEDEARLWVDHKLGDVVDDYEFIQSEVDRLAPIHEDQRAGRRLMEVDR